MDMSIEKVAVIILAVAVVLIVLGFFEGTFNDLLSGFTDSVSYPTPNN